MSNNNVIEITLVLENCEQIVVPIGHIISFYFDINHYSHGLCNGNELHTHNFTDEFHMVIKDLHKLYVSGFVGDHKKVLAIDRLYRSRDITNIELVYTSLSADHKPIKKYVGVPWGHFDFTNPYMTIKHHKGYYNYDCHEGNNRVDIITITKQLSMQLLWNYIRIYTNRILHMGYWVKEIIRRIKNHIKYRM